MGNVTGASPFCEAVTPPARHNARTAAPCGSRSCRPVPAGAGWKPRGGALLFILCLSLSDGPFDECDHLCGLRPVLHCLRYRAPADRRKEEAIFGMPHIHPQACAVRLLQVSVNTGRQAGTLCIACANSQLLLETQWYDGIEKTAPAEGAPADGEVGDELVEAGKGCRLLGRGRARLLGGGSVRRAV